MTRVAAALLFALIVTAAAQADRSVAFDPQIGKHLPKVALTDASGLTQPLLAWTKGHPALIVPVYFSCPNLCDLTLRSLKSVLPAKADVAVLAVSIDPRESAQTFMRKRESLAADARWRFLGGDAAAIRSLTAALGFRYFYDERQRQFAHAAGIVVVDRSGRIASFFPGVRYSSAQLDTALSDASRGTIARVTQHLLMTCFDYDPQSHRYSARIVDLIRMASIATVLVLTAIVGYALRRERHRSRIEPPP